jgi:hypothetical protein
VTIDFLSAVAANAFAMRFDSINNLRKSRRLGQSMMGSDKLSRVSKVGVD